MCALCGVLGGADHWTDAAPRPGVFTRNSDTLQRRRERQRRVACEGRLLAYYRLSLSDWQGTSLLLSTATGKTEKDHGIDSEDYSRTGMTVALGNQWSWEDVTFSWNWLSLTYNFSAKIGGTNLLDKYPSNKSGGMVLVSGLGFGAEW